MIINKKAIETSYPKITPKKHFFAILAMFISCLIIIAMIIIFDLIANNANYMEADLVSLMVTTIFLVFCALYFYIFFTDRKLIFKTKNIIMFCAILVLAVFLNLFIGKAIVFYARPFALFAALVTILLGRQIGVISNIMFAIIMLFADMFLQGTVMLDSSEISLLLLSVIIGLGFVFLISKNAKRFANLLVGLYLVLPTIIIVIVIEWTTGTAGIDILKAIGWSALSTQITSVLFIAFLLLFETIFNVTTNFRLIELADHDSALLKRLEREAPGTFNHSYMVSNLAESCAYAIGENTHLARLAALCHDIGKLKNPEYFNENLGVGVNPHDTLSPDVSVTFIKKHISYGVQLAKEYKLPEEVVDVIKEHHGTTLIKSFYSKALDITDGKLPHDEYVYDGPKPTSKISAIMMLVDASEAALRSVDKKDIDKVRNMVENVFNERMSFKQFTDCNITLKELSLIKETIIKSIIGLYHERTGYTNIAMSEMGVK